MYLSNAHLQCNNTCGFDSSSMIDLGALLLLGTAAKSCGGDLADTSLIRDDYLSARKLGNCKSLLGRLDANSDGLSQSVHDEALCGTTHAKTVNSKVAAKTS